MTEASTQRHTRRQEYIGRAARSSDATSGRKDAPAWVVPVLILVFLVGALRLAADGGIVAMGLIALPALAVALAEFERRRLRSASFGYLDARVSPGQMIFTSARSVVWLGVAVTALGGASLVVFVLVLPELSADAGRRGGPGLLLVAALICIGIGVGILWSAARSTTVTIDRSGVAVRAPMQRSMRVVQWADGIFADAHRGTLTVASGRGSIAAPVRYLRTDPVIVADIINRCSVDPALRERLGSEMVDLLKAEEPWRRNRPASADRDS